MATRRSEWLAAITPVIDRESAKKDAVALAKELSGILEVKVDATPEDLSELTKVFNQQLKTMGKQPIVFSDTTLRGIVSQFTQAISQGVSKGFNDGVITGTSNALKQLQAERDQLLGNQKSLKTRHQKLKQINDFAYNISDTQTNKAHAFSSDEISQMKTNASKLGQSFDDFILSMKSSVEELQYKMSKLKPGAEGYTEAITSFYEQSFDLFRMSRTLSKHPNLVQDSEILEDYSFDNLKDMFADDIVDNVDSFDVAINKSYQSLDGIVNRLKEIDVQLQTIQNQDSVINESAAKSALKTLDEIETKYREFTKAYAAQHKQSLNSYLDYTPKVNKDGEIADGIRSFAQQYNKAALSGDWTKEYGALLKYVRLYESYLEKGTQAQRTHITKKNNPFTQLYDQLKPMAQDAENMLRNVVNMMDGMPLVGMGGAEAEKTASSGKVAANAAQAEAKAKTQVKEAAEATVNANQKSASAETKATINAKEKADANIESAKATQKEALAQERSAKAALEKANAGSILDNPMFANMFGKTTKQAEEKQIANEGSAKAAQKELSITQQTTAELEKQQKLLLYRRVEGQADLNRISGRSVDALYDKTGKPIIQDALEMGFGGFGDGLYATTLDAAKDLMPSSGAFSFLEFDASAYNLFINKTAEQAEALQSFLLSLQKLVGAGTILDTSELTHIADLSNDQLFEEAQKIFKNFSMSKQQFDAWIESAKAESEVIANLFASGQIPSNRHNFGTRFMQTLGYDGVLNQTGDLDFDGNYQGSVIYDPKDDIKQNARIFKDIQEFSSYIQQQTQAHQQNAAAMNVEANAQEHLNQVEGQNPQTSDAIKQEALSYEDLKQKVEAYIKIRQQMWSLMDQKQPWQQLLPDVDAAAKEITSLFPESGEAGIATASMVGNMLQNQVISDNNIKSLAQTLGIEIPQAAQQAEGALNGVAGAQERLNTVEAQESRAATQASEEKTETDAIQQQNQALQENINLKQQSNAQKVIGAVNTGVASSDTTSDGGADVAAEAGQLAGLQKAIENVTTSVGAKTKAFTAEETEVKRVVDSEINSLTTLEQKVLSIKGTLEGLLTNLKTGQSDVGADLGNITVTVNKQETPSTDATLATENTLGAVKAVLDAINGKIVAGTKGGSSKQSRGKSDNSSKKKTDTTQKKSDGTNTSQKDGADQTKRIEKLNSEIGTLQGELNNVTNDGIRNALQNEIALRERIIQLIQEESAMSSQEEARQIKDLSEKTKAAKAAAKEEEQIIKKTASDQKKAQKKAYNDFVKDTKKEAGLSQASSTMNKARGTLTDAALIDNKTSEATAKVQQLYTALEQLNATYTKINSSDGPVDPKDQQMLIAQRENVQQLQSAVAQLVTEHQRLSGVNAQQIGMTSLGLDASSTAQQEAITRAVMAATQGRAAIKGFNADTNKLTYTLKTGANQFTTFKAAVDKTNGSIMSVRGNTTQVAGVFETLGSKIKEYSYYITGLAMVERVISWVREGVTVIKEIDTALTELKKVTDETKESYEKFLDTAAETADKVGSTITKIVNSTADWAKLGYSMQEAAQLAESTSVLLNVSEFQNIDEATSALISTMQAFGYASEDSMRIVDVMNEVGKLVARR